MTAWQEICLGFWSVVGGIGGIIAFALIYTTIMSIFGWIIGWIEEYWYAWKRRTP